MELPGVAVIGCGNWGKNLVRNFARLGALKVVCESEPARMEMAGREYPHVRVTNQFVSVLRDPAVQAVVIATPSDSHFPLAQESLLAGKHVYVEKPLARDVNHARELDRLASERNLILMVGHLLLYHPAVNLLKDLIASGELGDLLFVRSDRMNFNLARRDWSVLWDLAPHDISMMCHLLDPDNVQVTRVGGWDTMGDGLVDVAYLDLSFEANHRLVPGQIRNSWLDPHKLVRLTVNGSAKTAVLDDAQSENKLALHHLTSESRIVVEYPEYTDMEPLYLECEHFLKCLITGERPRTDANNAFQVVSILADVTQRLSSRPPLRKKSSEAFPARSVAGRL